MARSTIGRGWPELRSAAGRRCGSGSSAGRRAEETLTGDATLLDDLRALVEPATRGDPQSPLLWTAKSLRNLAAALRALGHRIGHNAVAELLRELGYSLQANRKTREGSNHPDRDAQFGYINAQVKEALAAGQPAISVDTKKKELVGDFKNAGRELRPKGQPEPVRVHDFLIPELGRAVPYGVYDIAANAGWVSVGIDHDTAGFAVNEHPPLVAQHGRARYPDATRLLITADCGGSNGARVRLWKRELQSWPTNSAWRSPSAICRPAPANGTRSSIACSPSSPQNWRGKPLVSYQVIVAADRRDHHQNRPKVAAKSTTLISGRRQGVRCRDGRPSTSRATNSTASGITLSDQGRHPNRSGYRSTGPNVYRRHVGAFCLREFAEQQRSASAVVSPCNASSNTDEGSSG